MRGNIKGAFDLYKEIVTGYKKMMMGLTGAIQFRDGALFLSNARGKRLISELGATVSVGSMISENKIIQARIENKTQKLGLNINIRGNAMGHILVKRNFIVTIKHHLVVLHTRGAIDQKVISPARGRHRNAALLMYLKKAERVDPEELHLSMIGTQRGEANARLRDCHQRVIL